MFTDGGKQINQQLNSRAGLAVNNAVFSRFFIVNEYTEVFRPVRGSLELIDLLVVIFSVRFTGVLFVQTKNDDDVVGFLFGYQVPGDDDCGDVQVN